MRQRSSSIKNEKTALNGVGDQIEVSLHLVRVKVTALSDVFFVGIQLCACVGLSAISELANADSPTTVCAPVSVIAACIAAATEDSSDLEEREVGNPSASRLNLSDELRRAYNHPNYVPG